MLIKKIATGPGYEQPAVSATPPLNPVGASQLASAANSCADAALTPAGSMSAPWLGQARLGAAFTQWARKATPGEQRGEALRRINQYMQSAGDTLMLTSLGLRSAPTGLSKLVGLRKLYLDDNQLPTLPDDLLAMPAQTEITAYQNPLSQQQVCDLVERIGSAAYTGPCLKFDHPKWLRAALLRWHQECDLALPPDAADRWAHMQDEPHAEDFALLLGRLRDTADYRQAWSREMMRSRLTELFADLQSNPVIRQQMFGIAHAKDAANCCPDALAILLDEIDCARINDYAAHGLCDQKQLLDIGKKMFRLDCLNRLVRQRLHNDRLPGAAVHPEAEQIRATYLVGLAQKLDLPITTANLIYPFNSEFVSESYSSAVSRANLKHATRHIYRQQKKRALRLFLARWSPFQQAFERDPNCAARLNAERARIADELPTLRAKLYAQLAALDQEFPEHENPCNADCQRYAKAAQQLQCQFDQANRGQLDQLYLQFTEAFLAKQRGWAGRLLYRLTC